MRESSWSNFWVFYTRFSILHLSASFMCFAMMAFLSLERVLPKSDTGLGERTPARSLPKGAAVTFTIRGIERDGGRAAMAHWKMIYYLKLREDIIWLVALT